MDSLLAKERRWNEIIGYWDALLQTHPNNSQAYLERAGAYHHKGDRASAIRDLEASAGLGNKEAQALLTRVR